MKNNRSKRMQSVEQTVSHVAFLTPRWRLYVDSSPLSREILKQIEDLRQMKKISFDFSVYTLTPYEVETEDYQIPCLSIGSAVLGPGETQTYLRELRES